MNPFTFSEIKKNPFNWRTVTPKDSFVKKYNPNHEPAGSSKGGQFAPSKKLAPKPDWTQEMRDTWEKVQNLSVDDPSYKDFEQKLSDLSRQQKDWNSSVLRALSRGEVSVQDAFAAGVSASSHGQEEVKDLPSTLYHVTTAAELVSQQGLKTRSELAQSSGFGLGGGPSDTISFTEDKKIAEGIHDAVLFARDVFSGDISFKQLVDYSKEGHQGSSPFYNKLVDYLGGYKENYPGEDISISLKDVIDGTTTKKTPKDHDPTKSPFSKEWKDNSTARKVYSGEDYDLWQIDTPPKTAQSRKESLFKAFMSFRESAGGPLDPLFFGSDLQSLGKTPREQIRLMQFDKTNPNAKGYQVSSLGEWRTYTGDVVSLGKVLKFNPYHDKRTGRFISSEGVSAPSNRYSQQEKKWLKELKSKQRKFEKENPDKKGMRYDTDINSPKFSESEMMRTLKAYSSLMPVSVEGFVLKEGEEHQVPASNPGIALAEPKECFRNSAMFVLENSFKGDRYEYCEGKVFVPGLPMAIDHAWVMDTKTQTVVDPTLGWVPAARYYGVQVKTDFLRKKLSQNKYFGLMSSGFRYTNWVMGTDEDYSYRTPKT